jgi:hypothetical protein
VSPETVSADTIPNSAVGIFSPKTEGTKTKAAGEFYMRMVFRKIRLSPILQEPFQVTAPSRTVIGK